MSGYIKLHRQLKGWEWYTDVPVKTLFIHLLIEAEFEDRSYRSIPIKRGSLVAGRKKLALETGLSEQQVRTALDKLVSTNEITIQATSEFSIISVKNYEKFQSQSFDSNHQSTSKITTNQPTEQPHKKENKKLRIKENNNLTVITKEKSQAEIPGDGIPTNSVKRFKRPEVSEIEAYCLERKNGINPQNFFDFYEAKGWLIGRTPMKDWKAAVRTWEKNESKGAKQSSAWEEPPNNSEGEFLAALKKSLEEDRKAGRI